MFIILHMAGFLLKLFTYFGMRQWALEFVSIDFLGVIINDLINSLI